MSPIKITEYRKRIMDYDVKRALNDDAIIEVAEPVAAYAVGKAAAKPWTVAGGHWGDGGEECPICAKHRDPVTGEPRYNAKTIAAIVEGRAILRGEVPAKRYNSLEEMLADLDSEN